MSLLRSQSQKQDGEAMPGASSRLPRNSASAITARFWPGISRSKPVSSSERGIDDFHQRLDRFLVVGQAFDQRGAAGGDDVEAGLDQRRGVDQQAGAGDFFQVAVLQGAEGLGDADQALGEVGVAAGFADQDRLLALGCSGSRSASRRNAGGSRASGLSAGSGSPGCRRRPA
jgi:hypothetical protein